MKGQWQSLKENPRDMPILSPFDLIILYIHKQKYTPVLSCTVQHTLIENVASCVQTVVLFGLLYSVFKWRVQVPLEQKHTPQRVPKNPVVHWASWVATKTSDHLFSSEEA